MGNPENNIRTYTGLMMDPFHIRQSEVRIKDIAHALSMMVRANGHLNSFFSIAQHCLNCAAEALARGLSQKVQLACLLHDAAECYIADVPRPVKHRLKGYAEIDQRVTDTVFLAFGIAGMTREELNAVCSIDDAMLYYEFEALTGALISKTKPYTAGKHDFSPRQLSAVESEFIRVFQKLYDK